MNSRCQSAAVADVDAMMMMMLDMDDDAAAAGGGGVDVRHGGRMVDRPLVHHDGSVRSSTLATRRQPTWPLAPHQSPSASAKMMPDWLSQGKGWTLVQVRRGIVRGRPW